MVQLVLASRSPVRKTMLEQAGLEVRVMPADLDEAALKCEYLEQGATPSRIAQALASAKAHKIAKSFPDAFVIGSDQTLEFHGRLIDKPDDRAALRSRFILMQGQAHLLHSAVYVVNPFGAEDFAHLEQCSITLRKLEAQAIDDYLARAPQRILGTVGGYQIEGLGLQLIEHMQGSYFSILGLPLLPLLQFLRPYLPMMIP
ncbi:MAG: Maf family protein [Pseudomonadota bacterium]